MQKSPGLERERCVTKADTVVNHELEVSFLAVVLSDLAGIVMALWALRVVRSSSGFECGAEPVISWVLVVGNACPIKSFVIVGINPTVYLECLFLMLLVLAFLGV